MQERSNIPNNELASEQESLIQSIKNLRPSIGNSQNPIINEKERIKKECLNAFKDFFDNLPELPKEFDEYGVKLAGLIEDNASEEDPRWAELEPSRKALQSYAKSLQPNNETENRPSFSDLIKRYPEQSKDIENIFKILHTLQGGDELDKVVKEIAKHLNFSEKKLLSFFQERYQKRENHDAVIKHHEEKIITEINKKITNTENLTKSSQKKPSVDKKIEELTLTFPSQNSEDEECIKKNLKEYISKIDSAYEAIKTYKPEKILNWAKKNKGHLAKENIDNLCTTIAVMERANELTTLNDFGVGHRLRYTQKMAILIFMLFRQGHISQIFTGEGKTTIISFVQSLKVFQGYKAHIITSNSVLAEEGVKDKERFYTLLNISVGHNNPLKNPGQLKACYTKDIVYGCISNFQFDWLRHSFEQLKTMGNTDFDKTWVMLDEIDSLLIDQGGNIAKLSEPFPGMESLQYVYINIWIALNQAEEEIEKEILKKLQYKAELFLKTGQVSPSHFSEEYQKFNYEPGGIFFKIIKKKIKDRIKEENLINKDLIIKHLHPYVKRNIDQWITNAFMAKHYYNENVEYRILRESEDIIVPVDNENTGVSMKNTIFSKGLHQFLQIKHNLTLTYENLTSCYISNLNYIKLYKNKLSGVTGTLGSSAEQKLLSSVFNLSFSRIPSHEVKFFTALPGMILDDQLFINYIACLALREMDRAVLIICNSIKDVDVIDEAIQSKARFAGLKPNIKIYRDESRAYITNETVHTNEIIIATNIASRGADFKTSMDLEERGGLHVIQAFLACNRRVQDQAAGRTSRQGNKGSAQMIVRDSELIDLGISFDISEYGYFEKILKQRDQLESQRLEIIREDRIPELEFKDSLFNHFANLYGNLKNTHKKDEDFKYAYVLMDLKERWAFWLDEQNYTIKTIAQLEGNNTETKAAIAFNQFIKQTRGILNFESQTITIGEITYNPYYNICLAERYLEEYNPDSRKKAENALENALKISGHSKLLYSAHHKLFEVAIENGGQIFKRYKEAMEDIFGLPDFICEEGLDKYKEIAYGHLQNAQSSIMIEHQYLGSLLGGTNSNVPSKSPTSIETILIAPKTPFAKPAQGTEPTVNFFMKNLHSRYICLEIYLKNIQSLMSQIIGPNALEKDIILGTKIPRYLATLDSKVESQKQLKSAITRREVNNFEFVGISSIMQLQEIHPVDKEIIKGAHIQMALAVSFLAAAFCLPPLMATLGPLAGIIISEAITDIIMALIDQGYERFNRKEYIKGKVISYGISIVTLGLSAIPNNSKIIAKALSVCRSLSNKLKRIGGPFEIVCKFASELLGKLEKYLAFTLQKIELAKKSHIEKVAELSTMHQMIELHTDIERYYKLYKAMNFVRDSAGKITPIIKQSCMGAIKGVAISVSMEKILVKSIHRVMEDLKPYIERHVKETVVKKVNEYNIALNSLRMETIDNELKLLFNVDSGDIEQVVRAVALGVLKHCKSWMVQGATLISETASSIAHITTYTNNICDKFLNEFPGGSNATMSHFSAQDFADRVGGRITELLYHKLVGAFSTAIITVPQIGYKSYQEYQNNKTKQKAIQQIGKNIQAVNNANQDANCTLVAIAALYEKSVKDVIHSFGLSTTSSGASIEDIKQLFRKNGLSFQECNLDNLAETFRNMKSDRAVAFLSGNNGIGHAIPVYHSRDIKKFFINFTREREFTHINFLVPSELRQETLAKNQYLMNQNRLTSVLNPIRSAGLNGDPAYGVLQSGKRQLSIEAWIEENNNPGKRIKPGNPGNPIKPRNPGNPIKPRNPGNPIKLRNPGNRIKLRNPGNPIKLRDESGKTENAIFGSGNDELLQSAKFPTWKAYGLVQEFFFFRVPTEEVVWIICKNNKPPQLAGHSGALRRANSPRAFVTTNQKKFHDERNAVIEQALANKTPDEQFNSYAILAEGLSYTIQNTAGEVKINDAYQKNSSLFDGILGTNGDLGIEVNRNNFIKKNQVARDIKKLIVHKADQMSGKDPAPVRRFSVILSNNNTFFKKQSEAINEAKTPKDLGLIAMTPTPYDPVTPPGVL